MVEIWNICDAWFVIYFYDSCLCLSLYYFYFILFDFNCFLFIVFSYHNFCYSSSLLKFTLTSSFRSNISNNTSTSIFYTLSYVFIILFSLFYAYTALCARLLHYHDLFYVYLLFSYWFSINTICNVIYMITSHLSTGFYFTSNTPKPLQWPLSFVFKLSLVNNLGIAAKMALILPFVDFIKIGARTKPKLLQDFFFKINEKLASYLSKVSDLVITIFKKVSRFIDRKFTYPSRIGMIYSLMYGIKVKDGCTKYAENSVKYYINLLNETCTVGNNLGAICLIAAVTGGFAVYSICRHYVNSSNQATMSFLISGATGFFFVFALVQVWRSMIRGMYEGILVGFSEMSFRMRNLDNNVANMLGNEYQKELDRRINCQPLGSPLTSLTITLVICI
ncbi:hypothetical protein TRFO_10761 [Tritrichomonas foetus]|uniref:Uncharacterized protein n=1 Tax=Tritrichomonas foetus TaxID=1144522 RepID=A0A1J4J8M1_9EUKA|nr:hypothetical protein TRFO_10761 [Tritrichomonas foetus]|eukprot:OHS95041.1 hypothetical protein TRFO_10761 [Tritrichomonas foetus]